MSSQYISQIVDKLSSTHLLWTNFETHRPDMRSSFNQLLAALASFDLLYLFTMLLEGVSISFSFRYFERMFKMLLNENVLSCKRNMWILFSCIFFVCHHYFTCRPWSVSNLLKLSCWDDDMGGIWEYQIADRLVLSRFGKRGGRRGRGGGEFEGWSGAYLQEKDYRPKSISAICYSSTQPEYLNLLVSSLLMTSAGKLSWNCKAQIIFCWVQ